jgi:hypothetical protein
MEPSAIKITNSISARTSCEARYDIKYHISHASILIPLLPNWLSHIQDPRMWFPSLAAMRRQSLT